MDVMQGLFLVFASIASAAALGVVLSSHPVRAVLFLILSFLASAGTWMLLGAEFLSLALILVYVGAVMILFLFVVMMLDVEEEVQLSVFFKHLCGGIGVASLFFGLITFAVTHSKALFTVPLAIPAAGYSSTKSLGALLFTEYLYPFEVAGLLLLAGMIAAIALTYRGPKADRRVQSVSAQVKVTKADRLRRIPVKGQPPKEDV